MFPSRFKPELSHQTPRAAPSAGMPAVKARGDAGCTRPDNTQSCTKNTQGRVIINIKNWGHPNTRRSLTQHPDSASLGRMRRYASSHNSTWPLSVLSVRKLCFRAESPLPDGRKHTAGEFIQTTITSETNPRTIVVAALRCCCRVRLDDHQPRIRNDT